VSIQRISNIQLTYDDADVFITATLLDKTSMSGKILMSSDIIIGCRRSQYLAGMDSVRISLV